MDYIPQRDTGTAESSKPLHMNPQQEAHARATVGKLPRPELEDKYLRSQEETIMLKRHVRKQEEKIKRISTKLIRLVNDRKKWSSENAHTGKRSTREVSMEETIETQQDKIRKLEKDNELMKQKLHVAHQQLLTQGRRHTPYGHVPSRINSGIDRRPVSLRERPKSGNRSRSPGQDSMATSLGPRYGHSLLEEAREENRNMHDVILGLQEQLANMEREHNLLQNELRLKSAAHEEDLLKFKEQMNSTKKTTLSENIELIRLQREIKEKTTALQSIEARYRELQDTHHNVRTNYDRVLLEMDNMKSKLLEEEKRSLGLPHQMKHGSRSDHKTTELQQMVNDLEREVEILKDANERLTNSAFASEQDQKWRRVEHELRKKIAQLESVVQYDLKDKDSVLQKAASERAANDRMHEERRRIHEECSRLRADNQDLRNRLRLVSSLDDAVDIEELEEALSVVRRKRHLASERKRPDFLEADVETKDVEVLYNELQVQHADAVQELEKTREMLLMQHRINKDYQIEVESVSNKMEEMKREYESKLEHFAQLLDARAARVKKLEKQLHDVAYGTKQFKYKPDEEEEMEAEDDAFDITRLERGENLLEININKVTLSRDALQAMDDREPSTFVTFAFYDYELVSTPILKNGSPRFDFTSQYIVSVDDLLLHHLQKDSTLIEMHQAFGTEYKTMCACKIRLNQLLDKPQGKLHGSAILTGVSDGANFGTLDFWVRLRVPMDQAIRLYKERTKALGYLAANSAVTQKELDTPLTLQREENFNQLEVRIVSCNHVQARKPGAQPNVYCVFKFYDFADHDTAIIPNSNNPHFDDHQLFPVQMTSDLDAYLKSEKLAIYVFDDADPDVSSYLGKATVNLIPLAHDKVIKAPFQLYRPDDTENGTVEIGLRWKLPYRAPELVMRIPESEMERMEKQQQQEDQMIPVKLISHSEQLKGHGPPSLQKPRKTLPVEPRKAKVSGIKPISYESETVPKVVHSAPEPKSPELGIIEAKMKPLEREDLETPLLSEESESVRAAESPEEEEPSSPKLNVVLQQPVPVKVLPKPKARTACLDLTVDRAAAVAKAIKEWKRYGGTADSGTADSGVLAKTLSSKSDFRQLKGTGTLEITKEDSPREGDRRPEVVEDRDADIISAEKPLSHQPMPPDSHDEEESIEEELEDDEDDDERNDGNVELDDDYTETDTDSVVQMDSLSVTKKPEKDDKIRISVNHLTLHPESRAFQDPGIQRFFVEYDFAGKTEETPNSLPKPSHPNQEISYNFSKVTHIDQQNNMETRDLVAAMIIPNYEVESTISFAVVSEPTKDMEECEDLGVATVDIMEILKSGRDIIDEDVEIVNGESAEPVGRLNVSVEALAALNSVADEVHNLLERSQE